MNKSTKPLRPPDKSGSNALFKNNNNDNNTESPSHNNRLEAPTKSQILALNALINNINNEGKGHKKEDVSTTSTLSGRQVMIPLTTKAFFEGFLDPEMISSQTSATTAAATADAADVVADDADVVVESNAQQNIEKSDDNTPCKNVCTAPLKEEEEMIVVNKGNDIFTPMTRTEASRWIQTELMSSELSSTLNEKDNKKLHNLKENTSKTRNKQQIQNKNVGFSMKKGFLNLNAGTKRGNNNRQHKIAATTTTTNVESISYDKSQSQQQSKGELLSLPCIEIREEYDKSGNEVRAEAVDIGYELNQLQERFKSKQQSSRDTKVKEDINEFLLEKLKIGSSMMSSSSPKEESFTTQSNGNEKDEIKTSSVLQNDAKSKSGTHHNDHDAIFKRLKELEELEKQDEIMKLKKTKNSKSLKGLGGWNKGFLNEDRHKKQSKEASRIQSHPIPNKIQEDDHKRTSMMSKSIENKNHKNKGKKVKFADEKSQLVSDRPTKSQPNMLGTMNSGKRINTIGLGTISERNFNNESSGLTTNRYQSENPPKPSSKRISRFARERKQGLS